ncbi:MAG: hypothetical protein AB8B97_23815 [Granulosicoccus sp.]
MRKQQSVNVLQVIPLVLAALLVTVGLSMYLSDTSNIIDAVRSIIVVFGGALAGLLLSFSMPQIHQALQLALSRGIQGGNSPVQMIRAMLKVCEVSRRDGLLGVAEIRSNSSEVEEICQLVGDAANDSSIRFALDRRLAGERVHHQMATDVFLFASLYAIVFGFLGSLFRYVSAASDALSGSTFLPFVSGASLAIMLSVLIARLRAAHLREMVITEIAYRGAVIMLEDNNVQRLHTRLALLVPPGFRS